MRKSAHARAALLLAGAAMITTATVSAATYETLTATVTAIEPGGLIVLHDGSTLALDKKVSVTGTPEVGASATVTYSADENGYDLLTVKFAKGPSAPSVARP